MKHPVAHHCACVIHGNLYDWIYVERLYNMLKANCSREIILHVFTESGRSVPAPYVKHELQEWPGIAGPKKSWWYKMQMFNSKNLQVVCFIWISTLLLQKI